MQAERETERFRHSAGPHWLPVAAAATQLGLTERGLRQRIKRGRVHAQQTAAGWRVAVPEPLPEPVPEPSGTVPEPPGRELVAVLEATVTDLRARLDTAEQAQAELRRLLAAMVQQRVLEAPRDTEGMKSHAATSFRPWWLPARWAWWR